jgi:hypothetical protein
MCQSYTRISYIPKRFCRFADFVSKSTSICNTCCEEFASAFTVQNGTNGETSQHMSEKKQKITRGRVGMFPVDLP